MSSGSHREGRSVPASYVLEFEHIASSATDLHLILDVTLFNFVCLFEMFMIKIESLQVITGIN